MGVQKVPAVGRPGLAAVLCALLLPCSAMALPNAPAGQNVPQDAWLPGRTPGPALALAPGFRPASEPGGMAFWPDAAAAGLSDYRSLQAGATLADDPDAPSFDVGGYDPLWDDARFGEIAAYGGLAQAAQRVAGMRAIDGSDGASGAIPYGRLTVARAFAQGRDTFALGAYGTQVDVRQTSITGFGDDSYTDVAVDGTWRFSAHPERPASDVFQAQLIVLREDEDLLASHAVFGTRQSDDLTMERADVSWSLGGRLVPAVQYFRIAGNTDSVRLGTLNGSPNSSGFIAELAYVAPDDSPSVLSAFDLRLSLQFVAYSKFDGSSRDSAANDAVLFHLSAEAG